MAKRKTAYEKNNMTFEDRLKKAAQKELNIVSQVNIAKKSYLMKREEDIKKALEEGYHYILLAQVATDELLESDLPRTFTVTTEEGEEVEREIVFTYDDIKNFIENKD